jgi:hypothetical protein
VALESITSDTPSREGGSLFGRLNLSSENLNQNAGLGHFTSVELAPFAKPLTPQGLPRPALDAGRRRKQAGRRQLSQQILRDQADCRALSLRNC